MSNLRRVFMNEAPVEIETGFELTICDPQGNERESHLVNDEKDAGVMLSQLLRTDLPSGWFIVVRSATPGKKSFPTFGGN